MAALLITAVFHWRVGSVAGVAADTWKLNRSLLTIVAQPTNAGLYDIACLAFEFLVRIL
jgi:hypothetical protein